MMLEVHWAMAVLLNAVMWVVWSAVVGWRQASRPWSLLTPGRLGRVRPWEDDGRWYQRRLRVRRWKAWLPEAGTWFGGVSKRQRPSVRDGGWPRLAAECLRAERTHGWIMAATPLFVMWNPLGLFLANVVFALVANLPCWIVARSTRARLQAIGRGAAGQQ